MRRHQICYLRRLAGVVLVSFQTRSFTSGLQSLQPVNTRRGAKHMKKIDLEKFDPHLPLLPPQELQERAEQSLKKTPGSHQYGKKWRYWTDLCVASIRQKLSENLPHPAEPDAFAQLFYELGTAADRGEMPSFAHAGSRSGYAIEFFCRARLLADLLFNQFNPTLPHFWEDSFHEKHLLGGKSMESSSDLRSGPVCRITSLGGGPGYDHLSVLFADTYRKSGKSKTRIETTVFDYEEGWGDLVDAMRLATDKAMVNENQSGVHWGGRCDITKPLSDPINAACRSQVATTDIFICQYTVAENARPLRGSDFKFFADLFEVASDKTIFLFTETTPRVWPDFADLLINDFNGGKGFQIGFPRNPKRGKTGPQLVIQKREGACICQEDLAECDRFRRLQAIHDEKIKKGYQRQSRKVKGSKDALQ